MFHTYAKHSGDISHLLRQTYHTAVTDLAATDLSLVVTDLSLVVTDLAATDLSLAVTDLAATYLSHFLRHCEVSGDIKQLRYV